MFCVFPISFAEPAIPWEGNGGSGIITDLKIDNLDRVSIPTKIVATFDVKHPILGTTYGV